VVADAHLVADPEAITDAFDREFARMAKAARARKAREEAARPGTVARRRPSSSNAGSSRARVTR